MSFGGLFDSKFSYLPGLSHAIAIPVRPKNTNLVLKDLRRKLYSQMRSQKPSKIDKVQPMPKFG